MLAEQLSKRICFFPGTLSLGGIGKLFINLIEEYSNRGIQVDLFLTKKEGEFLKQVPENVRVFEGNGSASASIASFIKYLHKEKPHAVISAREYLNIVNIVCCATTLNRTKAIVSLHTNQTAENFHSQHNSALLYKKTYFKLMAKLLYRVPSKIVAVSEGVADDFAFRMGVKRRRIKVIYNPVYKPYNFDSENIEEVDERFKNLKTRFIIGVGRLTHQKDFATLIESFYLLRKKEDVSLVILGEGPLRKELEQQIERLSLSDHVLLLGFVSNPLYYVRRASALVVSSKFEGFGNTIVEALGVGTPVVSTNCPSGPEEILQNGKYGILVPTEDPNQMAAALTQLLNNEHYHKKELIGRAKDFAVSKIADKYLSYIYN